MVEFRDRNYWEDGKRQVRRPATTDSQGQPFVYTPTPADLNAPQPQGTSAHPDDMWARPIQPDTENSFLKAVMPFLTPGLSSIGAGQLIPNLIGTSANQSPGGGAGGDIASKIRAIAEAGSNAARDAGNRDPANITSMLNGIFSAGSAAAQNTPAWILNWLKESAGAPPSYNGPSAEEMADKQFNPLYAMLDKQAEAQGGRYNDASAKAKQSYADYVRSLQQGQTANKQMYADSGRQINENYGEAADTVSGNANQSFASLSDTLKRLGIQEGAGELAAANQKQVNQNLGVLGQNQQAAADLNSQLGANDYAYGTQRVNNGRQAGLNYQGDLLSQYTDQMNQADQQRLQLQGQEGQAENEYALQIQKLIQDQQGQYDSGISDQFKTLMDTRNDDRQFGAQQQQQGIDNLLAQSRLDLDATKAGIGVANPFDQLQASVAQKVGAGNAQQYMSTILNAMRDNPQAQSPGQLVAMLSEDDLRKPYMAQLAYAFFEKALNKTQ